MLNGLTQTPYCGISLFEKLRSESSVPRLLTLTAIGTSLQLIALAPAVYNAKEMSLPFIYPIYADNLLFTGLYFALPIAYCTFVSLLLYPKRAVSPLLIETLAVTLSELVAFIFAFQPYVPNPFQSFQDYVSWHIGLFLIVMLGSIVVFGLIIGAVQTLAVLWVVGLNLGDLDRQTFSLNISIDKLKESIAKSPLLSVWQLAKQPERTQGVVVYRRKEITGESMILALGPNPIDSKKSIVATVAFEYDFYGIAKSAMASDVRDSVLRDLKQILKDQKLRVKFDRQEHDGWDRISTIAYVHAKKPTLSKFTIGMESLYSIPKYFRFLIVGTTIILSIISAAIAYAFAQKIEPFSYDLWIGVAVILAVALFGEIGVSAWSVRREMSEKEAK